MRDSQVPISAAPDRAWPGEGRQTLPPCVSAVHAEAMPLPALQMAFWRATNWLHVRHGGAAGGVLPPDFPGLIGMDEVATLEREAIVAALDRHADWYASVILAD